MLRYAKQTVTRVVESGLPAGALVAAQDPAGGIWLGTDEGLYLLEGGHVQATSVLAGQSIDRLMADHRGNLDAEESLKKNLEGMKQVLDQIGDEAALKTY